MSYGNSPNPYSASPSSSPYSPVAAPIPKFSSLQYMLAYKYVMENQNWMMNLLCGGLAFLSTYVIPIIGPLVFMGYMYEIIDHLHRRRTMPYPDFDTNKFSDYLSRGVAPFVASLLFGVIAAMFGFIFYMVAVFGTIALAGALASAKMGGPIVASIIVFVVTLEVIVFTLVLVGAAIISTPMTLRAGLSGNIGEGFNFEFIKDFIARMWKDMLLAYLWLMFSGMLLGLVGALVCCVGAAFSWSWNMMASAHLQWQLYELYLDRGGIRIPLKAEVIPAKNPI